MVALLSPLDQVIPCREEDPPLVGVGLLNTFRVFVKLSGDQVTLNMAVLDGLGLGPFSEALGDVFPILFGLQHVLCAGHLRAPLNLNDLESSSHRNAYQIDTSIAAVAALPSY